MIPRHKVYDLYWYFAAERQDIFFRRLEGKREPFTDDPILQEYKFCNAYRASDRVSQFLIRNVIYTDKQFSSQDTLFRILLFRLFNKIETWQKLERALSEITLSNFSREHYSAAVRKIHKTEPVYGNAFILCAAKAFGFDTKRDNQLALLEQVFKKSTTGKQFEGAPSLKELFTTLRSLPLFGNFMAYQLAIDFNYSEIFGFDENDFTVAGPGALRGIQKCFKDVGVRDSADIIQHVVENQEQEFARLGLEFKTLWGRPLHAIDCQGLFCEVDKYTRVKLPHLTSARKKIKTRFTPSQEKIAYFYPPKWGINYSVE